MNGLPRGTPILAALFCLALPLAARGDGCVIDRLGRYVAEEEQLAFIDWQDGHERLYVTTRTVPTDQPTLWVVPVRASPDRVQAEPVATAPQVVYYQPVVERAQEKLNEALELTALLDSGLLPCALLVMGSGAAAKTGKDDVREYQRVEQFGMVVTVLSARSAEALDRYLNSNGVRATAAGLAALAPYLGESEEYALVCGWLARSGQKIAARAVRIDFPTPRIFYPLQPTRVYESEVRTVVHVRGLVRPTRDLAVPGVHCQYIRGVVKQLNLGYGLKASPSTRGGYRKSPPEGEMELLTRVEVTSMPSSWTSDLTLDRGAPLAIEAALFIDEQGVTFLWSASIVLGALLALLLPWATVPRERRRPADWFWAAGVGAATGLTLWVSASVYLAWRCSLSIREPAPARGGVIVTRAVLALTGTGISMILLTVVGLWVRFLFLEMVFLGGVGLLVASLLTSLVYLLSREKRLRGGLGFFVFMLAHGGLVCLIFFGLSVWLALYA